MKPLISILIPAYERPDYLKRSLDEIARQRFRDFEVIVTDDSATDSIEKLLSNSSYSFPLKYRKNSPPCGTPLNWTSGMDLASGDWIKILHDDDWLSDPDSLLHFAKAIRPAVDLVFSGYEAIYEDTGKRIDRTISVRAFDRLACHPHRLFAGNLIGPPSVLMFRRTITEIFDPALKWIVDWEGYIRMLEKYSATYIDKPLICMSYNSTQVTQSCFGNPSVEIPETLIYYQKHGRQTHSSWVTYDAWWRLIRNLSIRSVRELDAYAGDQPVPDFLKKLIRHQRLLPIRWWRFGILSKLGMFLSFALNRS